MQMTVEIILFIPSTIYCIIKNTHIHTVTYTYFFFKKKKNSFYIKLKYIL